MCQDVCLCKLCSSQYLLGEDNHVLSIVGNHIHFLLHQTRDKQFVDFKPAPKFKTCVHLIYK
ncbi:Uncharacterized protein APZ42_019424 [Daphnia magna]|uniref:Uncharacterized protein n=1 Tax=Daphnia magna TaxID=35525 RepID=A0A164Y529_9CRUS|nr:Uncharacterized protein APZ42_019424 [Daphnia magna]